MTGVVEVVLRELAGGNLWAWAGVLVAVVCARRVLWRRRSPRDGSAYGADYDRLAPVIRRQPCSICGRRPPTQANHLRYPRRRALRLRDMRPACPSCHARFTVRGGRPPWSLAPLLVLHWWMRGRSTPVRLLRVALRGWRP